MAKNICFNWAKFMYTFVQKNNAYINLVIELVLRKWLCQHVRGILVNANF